MSYISWKNVKEKILPVFLLGLICFSFSFANSSYWKNTPANESMQNVSTPSNPIGSGPEDALTGIGDTRSQRLYIQNESSSIGTNILNITSNDDEYLSEGQINFTFSKNYNTNYTFEDDSPLEYPLYRYTPSPTYISEAFDNGAAQGGESADDYKSDDSEHYEMDSAVDGGGESVILNITSDMIGANGANGFLELRTISDYDTIASLSYKTIVRVSGNDTEYSILAYDYFDEEWDVIEEKYISVSTQFTTIDTNIVNENGRYFNSTNNPKISIKFINSTLNAIFDVHLQYFKVSAHASKQVEIFENQPVALEFDTKGESTLYGFHAWIRTLNHTVGSTSNLTIQLFESNLSTPIKRSELLDTDNTELITPNMSVTPLAETSYINYTGDGLAWFNVTSDGAGVDLDIGNYYIVISNDIADGDFKEHYLVSIPYIDPYPSQQYEDPDRKIDHLLLVNNTKWEQVTAYPSKYACDAAGFAINITRAYFPEEIATTLDDFSISNSYNNDYPHDIVGENEYGEYWWGSGQVNVIFDDPLESVNGNFTIPLNSTEYLGDLSFTSENNIVKFLSTSANTNYILENGELPLWNVTYNLNFGLPLFSEGDFLKMGFVVPEDWTLLNIYHANETDIILNATTEILSDGYQEIIIDSDVINSGAGNYILQSNSPNYVAESEMSIHHNDEFWPSNGFMLGDDIHFKIGFLNNGDYLVDDGNGEVTLQIYNPSDVLINTISDTTVDENSTSSWYEFVSNNIITDVATTGIYSLVANWSNGEEIGYYYQEFYVNNYDINLFTSEYDTNRKVDQIIASIDTFQTDIHTYDIYIYGVENWTTQTEPAINRSIEELISDNLYMTSYIQDENVLNPDEDISIEVLLENRDLVLDYDVDVTAQIIMAQKNEWIIVEDSSSASIESLDTESTVDEHTFSLNLHIPTVNEGGINCPIRKAPMAVKLTISINSNEVYDRMQPDFLYYAEIDEADFEGNVLFMKEYSDSTGPGFIGSIERDLMNYPGYSYYFVQISNDYMQTMVLEYNVSQFTKVATQIANLEIEQDDYTQVSTINIVGTLMDEYENILPNTSVELYFNTTEILTQTTVWNQATLTDGNTFANTNVDGEFDLEFDLENVPISNLIQFEIRFAGNDTHLNISELFELQMKTYETDLQIIFSNDFTLIEGESNLIEGTIRNIGNSTLTNISFALSGDIGGKIYELDLSPTDLLIPGQSMMFQIELDDNDMSGVFANVTVKVSTTCVETNENPVFEETKVFATNTSNQGDILKTVGLLAFGVGLIGLYFVGARYVKTKYQEINAPLSGTEDMMPKKKQSGKYVTVSDLDDEKPSSDEDVTTLDDLLNEE